MAGLLDKIGKVASDAANMAGSKAGEMIEVGKLKNRINGRKQDANLAMRDIGAYYYGLYEQGKVEDPAVLELCERVKACNDEIAGLERQIQQAKEEYDAKSSMGL